MKRVILMVILSTVFFNNFLYAQTSWIINRSFEYDGSIPSILVTPPTGWNNLEMTGSKFRAGVFSDWSSDGFFALALSSRTFEEFNADDAVTLSQDVYLDDVNSIFFDMNLETTGGVSWLNSKRLVIVKIDEDIVWDSDVLGSGDLRGEYIDDPNLVIGADAIEPYRDGERHALTFGMVVVQVDFFPSSEYSAVFDMARFDTHCQGYGYLDSDFNHDCFVDFRDYGILAGSWMDEVEDFNMLDLDPNNHIDVNDLEIFVADWQGSSIGQEDQYIESDLNLDGIVNFIDYSMLELNPEDPNFPPDDVQTVIEQWLWTNWMYWVDK